MNIVVMSRENAMRYCEATHDTQAVIVSISTPWACYGSKPFKSAGNGVVDGLFLWFDDVEDGKNAMTLEHAKAIVEFVEKYKDCDVIVHCDEGVSRSAGIAAALLKHYNGDDSGIFGNSRYSPNMHCYKTMLSAFG